MPYVVEPYQYMQAQVGVPGLRGPPGNLDDLLDEDKIILDFLLKIVP